MQHIKGISASSMARSTVGSVDPLAELRAFEQQEKNRLGVPEAAAHWHNFEPKPFGEADRENTTILFGGLTNFHDALIEAAVTNRGLKVKALTCPDLESLRHGKEYGNRGQCNPTYFTVGNLIKNLCQLRDETGQNSEEIVDNYVFLTAGSCGPCRFGTYVTEYRKALADAGFEGFRVFQMKFYDVATLGRKNEDRVDAGLGMDLGFLAMFMKCLFVGDILNAIVYRTRPYEITPGATDRALGECRKILCEALRAGRSVLRALARCRKVIGRVEVDRLQPKPKVTIIGEFWAMTTEGDGNHRLQRFLEEEGAECDVQMITSWCLYLIWSAKYDVRERMLLRRGKGAKHHSETDHPLRTLIGIWLVDKIVRQSFYLFARVAGLAPFKLPDMDRLADSSHDIYPNQLRGGEGHLEVAKTMEAFAKKKAHMVVSVKPFGCMPSSGVSDGIQSLVMARMPEANYCPVETSGDAEVSFQSRIQMALFSARVKAMDEFEDAIAKRRAVGSENKLRALAKKRFGRAAKYPRHFVAGTGANVVHMLTNQS